MEYFTNQTQWQLQPPPSVPDAHAATNGAISDDWQKLQSSSVGPSTSAAATQSYSADPQSALDLSDPSLQFPELPVQPPNSTTGYWQSYPQPPYYYQYPYSLPLPVSSYSSLNGATTANPSPQQPTPPPQLDIDPSLTAGTSSNIGLNHSHTAVLSPYNYQQQHRQQPTPVYSINPSALLNSTTSPVSSSPNGQIPAARLSTSHPVPKGDLRDILKPLLTPARLTGSSAVGIIVRFLEQYGVNSIGSDERVELFSKLSVTADDQFFKAWVENATAMDITRIWLKEGIADAADGQLRTTINPILSALGRMRFTVQSLAKSKLGKVIIKLTKDSNSATRDLSLELEKKWRSVVAEGDSASSATKNEETEENQVRKRKLSESSNSKAAATPPLKKLALASPAAVKSVKKEPKVVVTAVKDVKSDSSFFSKPKAAVAKPKLPSFKKSSAMSATPSGGVGGKEENVAQPSSVDPFRDALMVMKRNASPKVDARATPPLSNSIGRSLRDGKSITKRKKSVTFAPDEQLEQIKFIERAVYDDDSEDNMHGIHSLRDLDRSEGAALHHAHLFEEQVDWMEPLPLDVQDEGSRGANSVESNVQDEREKNALGAIYLSINQVPSSPSEPAILPPEEVNAETKVMTLGKEMEILLGEENPPPSLQALLGQINATLPSAEAPFSLQTSSIAPQLPDMNIAALSSLSPSHIGQLFQQLGAANSQQQNGDTTWSQYQATPTDQRDSGANKQWDHSDVGWGERGRGRGGRGRGRGRGRARSQCLFFQQGRCKYGDQCDFSHDSS